jgi:hypothetical protein
MLMVRGDIVAFDLEGGDPDHPMTLPDDFGMVHDPTGTVLDPCVVYICRCKFDWKKSPSIHKSIEQIAFDYFGDDVDLVNASVAIPEGPWQFVGVVKTIHYERYGSDESHDGPFFHPFSDSLPDVELYKSRCANAYMLQLPEGCVLNERGYVKP